MKEVNFIGSGSSAVVTITVGDGKTTFKWELAQFVPDFLSALKRHNAAIGPENLILMVNKFKNYLRFAKNKDEALNNTVGNYIGQLRSVSRGGIARII